MKRATKAAGNPYFEARMACSTFNEKLSSREGAAELTGVDRTKLARIESNLVFPYPDEVCMMGDVYNAPELLNYHCTHECPIGKETVVKAEGKSIEQIAISAYISLDNAMTIKDILITAAENRSLDTIELPQVDAALNMLREVAKVAAELQILMKKSKVNHP